MKNPLLLLLILLYPVSVLQSQEVVFIKAKEKGNGFLKKRSNECFVILPNHVVVNYLSDISILDKKRAKSFGKLIETYEPDLALLRIKKNNHKCSSWNVAENFNEIINDSFDGVLEHVDDFGTSNLIHVNITAQDQQSISVVPKKENEKLSKGMSGSAFYIKHNNKKVVAGMLMSIENDLRTGYIYQIDDIMRTLSPFFEETVKKKIGVVILKDKVTDLKISNSLISHLNNDSKYIAQSNFKNKYYIQKEFNNLFSGRIKSNASNIFKNNLDEILLGKVTLHRERNAKKMFVIRTHLEVNIYSTKNFNLIKSIIISGKGINSNNYVAENQSLKSLLINIKKQL